MQSATTKLTTDSLDDQLDGRVIGPADPGYDKERAIWNGMIDRRPAAIARCETTADVVAAVNFARENDLLTAVRCGGHSIPGLSACDDGLLIDLAGLDTIQVDPRARIARAGGGVLWGAFDAATQEHGLHTPGGRVTTTGIGGFTTGGGYGWTSSKHGLTCDNLVSAEVVTAAGEVLTASADENEDLFWAIRGGGGNFGIVTRFDLQLHELGPMVLAGMALFPIGEAPRVLRGWRDYVGTAPEELNTAAVAITAPPAEFVPGHLQGKPVLSIAAIYVGDPEQAGPVMQPLKDLGPDADLIQPMPYTEFQAILDPSSPPGIRNYARGEYVRELSDEAIETFAEFTVEPSSPLNQFIIFQLGGAVARVPGDATAFSNREAPFILHPISVWEEPAEDKRQIAANREFCKAMAPHLTGGTYVNFHGDQGRVRDAYGDQNYERLVALKDKYDPGNLFRLNQNIEPAGAA
jgi:FAD/FMN-containing dehydrogenase